MIFLFGIACLLPLAWHHNYCSSSINYSEEHNSDQSTTEQNSTEDHSAVPQAIKANATDKKTQSGKEGGQVHPWICDYHLTDVLLLYFTACLVVIGYFTMMGADKAVKDTERALVFGGPMGRQPGDQQIQMPPPQVLHAPYPIMMGVTNYGKTPAILKEYCTEFSLAEPTGKKAIYNFKDFNKIKLDTVVNTDNTGQPVFVGYAFSDFLGPHFCYGY
jgi:hypothetical protein